MKEAGQRDKGDAGDDAANAVRPEVSAALDNAIDLHRHAAVRTALLSEPGIALRMMVAHAIVGSPLWRVDVERQRAASDAIAASVEVSASEATFDQQRRAVLEIGSAWCRERVCQYVLITVVACEVNKKKRNKYTMLD